MGVGLTAPDARARAGRAPYSKIVYIGTFRIMGGVGCIGLWVYCTRREGPCAKGPLF